MTRVTKTTGHMSQSIHSIQFHIEYIFEHFYSNAVVPTFHKIFLFETTEWNEKNFS